MSSTERSFGRRWNGGHPRLRSRLDQRSGCGRPDPASQADWSDQGLHRRQIRKEHGSARPAELLAYARPGDTLAVVRLDRLGRSLAELLGTVTMLRDRQIALLSLEEKIDRSSAAGELVFHVFGAIAHFERRLISERTKDGIAA